ncbi:MAG: sugar ABC transporter permease, partial [Kribbellaceae bacterium]|nr:sugar ABC transporter permease [Kribbellaceae bacterium]
MVTMTTRPSEPLVKPRPQRAGLTRKRREALAAYAFLAPDTIGLLIFVAIPMLLAFGVAFFKVDGFGNYQFIGL